MEEEVIETQDDPELNPAISWMRAIRPLVAAPPLPVLESICLGFPALEAAPRTQSGDSDVV